MELKGRVSYIGDVQKISENFSKRDFAISHTEYGNDGQEYINEYAFQVFNDRIEMTNGLQVGKEIEVHFNIKSNKSEKDGVIRYFTNLNAWRIIDTNGPKESPVPANNLEQKNTNKNSFEEPKDDLPF